MPRCWSTVCLPSQGNVLLDMFFWGGKSRSSVLHALFMVREGGKRQQVSSGGVKWSGNWVRPYTGMGSPHYLTQGTRTDRPNGGLLEQVLWNTWIAKNFKWKAQCCFIVIDYILMTTLGFGWKSDLEDWLGHILSVRDCGAVNSLAPGESECLYKNIINTYILWQIVHAPPQKHQPHTKHWSLKFDPAQQNHP